jgi:hypothetical protein
MYLTALDYAEWSATTLLEVFLCNLALRHGLFHRLPYFTTYSLLLVSREVIWWVAYHLLNPLSPVTLTLYWSMQAVLLAARGAVIAEICWRLLVPYPGIWKLCRSFMIVIAAILITTAAVAAHRNGPEFARVVLTAERGLELVIVGILLFGLAFCRHYGLKIESPIPLVALGLGLYSAIQVANNTFFQALHGGYFDLWSAVRHVSFGLALVAWCIALWRPLPAPRPAPVLFEREVYDQIAPQMSSRLRELNARLSEMLK